MVVRRARATVRGRAVAPAVVARVAAPVPVPVIPRVPAAPIVPIPSPIVLIPTVFPRVPAPAIVAVPIPLPVVAVPVPPSVSVPPSVAVPAAIAVAVPIPRPPRVAHRLETREGSRWRGPYPGSAAHPCELSLGKAAGSPAGLLEASGLSTVALSWRPRRLFHCGAFSCAAVPEQAACSLTMIAAPRRGLSLHSWKSSEVSPAWGCGAQGRAAGQPNRNSLTPSRPPTNMQASGRSTEHACRKGATQAKILSISEAAENTARSSAVKADHDRQRYPGARQVGSVVRPQ